MDDPVWTVVALTVAGVLLAVAVAVRNRYAIRRRLGLTALGIAFVLLGEHPKPAYCDLCGRWLQALCREHLDEMATR